MDVICGIYKITNKINGKPYIGQSVSINNRWSVHKATKDNYLIHRALQKYGRNNFSFEILEECSEQELDEKEIYYIAKYNSCIYAENGYGYNLTFGGEGGLAKPVDQYTKDGVFVRRFNSIAAAASSVDKKATQISSCCYGRCLSCGGFLWTFPDGTPPDYRSKMDELGTTVDQYDLEGNYITSFGTIPHACEFINKNSKKKIPTGQIVACCKK